ncbi:hypothetical protein VaNZ11_004076 [Volvox africanus]|uniref:Transmembrane protein n=1 Tax=Volvox africanus TaxID=51714 RepID=A0ABQ5RVJ3_9CHLO|nr:hypothetical protein VaNZ11_004076 [Volvox africanus]
MARKADNDDAGFVKSSFWSPLVQDQFSLSITRSSIGASTGSRALRTGDWRRVAAADTDGEPVQVPPCDRYQDNTPNIDDVHSPASVNFDSSADPLMASPLVPRALAAGSGLSGCLNVDEDLDSPSSGFSLSGGEASLWLDSPAGDQLQDPRPSAVSPVQIRRPPPVDSELSTPGSDGYASPSVLFAIRPASLMRSSVQNPLFVERPASCEDDNVAKTLLLSSCAGRSPSSRLPRCTFESGWSSSSFSAEKSISLNPSQHNDKVSPLSHMEVTSSPPASSARQLLPLLTQGEMETPRRIIKNLSAATQDAVSGADLTTARAASPSRQHTELTLQGAGLQLDLDAIPQRTIVTCKTAVALTPCSAALPCLGRELGPPTAVDSPVRANKDPVDKHLLDPAGSKVVQGLQHRARTELSKITGCPNLAAADLDDIILAGRSLDQTPRKDTRTDNRHVGAGRVVPKETVDKRQRLRKLPRQEVTQRQGATERETQRDSPSTLRRLECCVLVPLLVVLVVLGIRSSSEWKGSAPRTSVTKRFDSGPVCFLERYPGENSMRRVTSTGSSILPIAEPTRPNNCTTAKWVQIPFCWRQLPNCHALDGLLSFLKVIAEPAVHDANTFDKLEAGEAVVHLDTSELYADSWAPVENLEKFPANLVGFPGSSTTHAAQPPPQYEASTALDASPAHDYNYDAGADSVQQKKFGPCSTPSDDISFPVLDERRLGAAVEYGLTDLASLPSAEDTEYLHSFIEVAGAPCAPGAVGDIDSVLASIPGSGVSVVEGLPAPDASDDALILQQPFLSALFTKRMYGWTLLGLILATAASCLAGVILAWVIELLSSSTTRPQRVVRCDNAGEDGNRPPPQPPVDGRILRPKRRPGGSMANQVAQGVGSAHSTVQKGRKGSFVWKDDMLVYIGD